jgi:DNA-binding NarL/FixJ family response regulator
LRIVLEREGGFELTGESGEALEGVAIAKRTRPDVVVLDVGMPGIDGIQAAHRLSREVPSAKVLVLSQYNDEEYVLEALGQAGAAGYLLKSDASSELLSALRAVVSGKRYISPAVAPIVLDKLRDNGRQAAVTNGVLTRREREILTLIAQGASAKEIAERLDISPKTVQTHRGNLATKLGLPSTAAIVRYAIRHKLMKVD